MMNDWQTFSPNWRKVSYSVHFQNWVWLLCNKERLFLCCIVQEVAAWEYHCICCIGSLIEYTVYAVRFSGRSKFFAWKFGAGSDTRFIILSEICQWKLWPGSHFLFHWWKILYERRYLYFIIIWKYLRKIHDTKINAVKPLPLLQTTGMSSILTKA